jgi:hypothetical protein
MPPTAAGVEALMASIQLVSLRVREVTLSLVMTEPPLPEATDVA